MSNTERRSFNHLERAELLRHANGRCRLCGGAITSATMEADHVLPHIGGGVTDVMNGQALCRTCNRRKGARTPDPAPAQVFTPRAWQVAAAIAADEAIERAGMAAEMVEAAVGCGKTKHALWRVRTAFNRDLVDLVVVIAPTVAIRGQWERDAAALFDMTLLEGFRPGIDTLDDEAHGIAVTFASVCGAADRFRELVRGRRVAVVVDEIHHASDQNGWGLALNHFLKVADYKIFLSGTPFRFDRERIVGLSYDEAGFPIPTYRYTYKQAVVDGVLRPVQFPIVDSAITWAERAMVTEAPDKVSEAEEAQFSRLHPAAVDPHGPLGGLLLDEFVAATMQQRRVHPRAAGAVICSDIPAATKVRDELKRRGHAAMLVVHEDTAAKANIARFRDKMSGPFIVAVGMLSEGVDIPRLCTLAYLSNRATKMALHQAVGRVLRRTDDEANAPITAQVFVPSFDRFTREVVEFEDAVYQAAKLPPAGVIHKPGDPTLNDLALQLVGDTSDSAVELDVDMVQFDPVTGEIIAGFAPHVGEGFRLHDALIDGVAYSGTVYPQEVCRAVDEWMAARHYPADPNIRQALLDAFGAEEFEKHAPRQTMELREIKATAQRLLNKVSGGDPVRRAALVDQLDAEVGTTLQHSAYTDAQRRMEILQMMDTARVPEAT